MGRGAARQNQRLARLKPGPGMAPDAVSADQERRLRTALFELTADRGYDEVSLRGLSRLAGVSTHTFYRRFRNLDEFFGSVCETAIVRALQRMAAASTAASDREEGLRVGVGSLLDELAERPDAVRLALVDAHTASPQVRTQMRAATRTFERLLAELVFASDARGAPRYLVRGMVAGTTRVARTTAMAGRADELPGLADELTEWLLAISQVATAHLERPTASRMTARQRREPSPFPDRESTLAGRAGIDERSRILRAVIRLGSSRGLEGLSIRRIRTEAGVSRRCFDSYFGGVVDAFLASIDWLAEVAAAEADRWAQATDSRDQRARQLLLALCAQAARNSAFASVILVGVLDAGRDGLLLRERLVTRGSERLREGRVTANGPGSLATEASVAAAWDIARAEVAAGRAKSLPEVAPLLAAVILAPVGRLDSAV